MATDDVVSICQKCGASVYKQHIDSGIARYEGGNLLCAHCAADYERSHDAATGADTAEFERITLDADDDDDDDVPKVEMSESRIVTTAHTLGVAGAWDDSRFNRPLDTKGRGATRCRTFHCKITEGAIEFMNNQINEWLDKHDNIVVKYSDSVVGPFEGKHTEPNLIITLFY